jgi:hypothetical protein
MAQNIAPNTAMDAIQIFARNWCCLDPKHNRQGMGKDKREGAKCRNSPAAKNDAA